MNKYDNTLFLRDFNCETSENYLNDFYNAYNLRNNVKESTCFKDPEINLYMIDCQDPWNNVKESTCFKDPDNLSCID